ncbi:hypothetical protein [Streptosporangium saharense]|uniref:hypothetical protein n=1 Tax=Streptosporangium saharense TaxID=1706840 RepID=UPI00341DEB51
MDPELGKRQSMTIDEYLNTPIEGRLRKLRGLPAEEAAAIHEEMRKRQQAFLDSYDGPVHRYIPSIEEGAYGCIDPYPDDD